LWVGRWLALATLWVVLTDTRKPQELVAGAVVAALGAWLAGLITRPAGWRPDGLMRAAASVGVRRLVRPLWGLVVDTGVIFAALWRQLVLRRPVRGSLRAAHYRPRSTTGTGAGRALAEGWGSLTPNRYVIGIDPERQLILVHELVRSDRPLDPFSD